MSSDFMLHNLEAKRLVLQGELCLSHQATRFAKLKTGADKYVV